MSKHAKDEQIPKRKLWPAVTTAVVVAVAAASAIALTGGSGPSVLTSDTAHDAAVKLAAVPAVTSKTFYGCERSTGNRKVFDVSLTKLRCPSGSHRVSWRGWSARRSPDHDADHHCTELGLHHSADLDHHSADLVAYHEQPACVAHDHVAQLGSDHVLPGVDRHLHDQRRQGSCGPYTYPQIQGNPSEITVEQDVWNPISGWQQTLTATNPGSWQVTANMPDKNTAVISFPNTGAGAFSAAVQLPGHIQLVLRNHGFELGHERACRL